MKGLALVVGAGGIGTQLAKDLNESEKGLDVVLCGRKSEFNPFWELDIEDSQSLLQLKNKICLLYTSPSPRDMRRSRMPSSA